MVRHATKVVLRSRPTANFADESIALNPNRKTITLTRTREETSTTGQKTHEEASQFLFDAVLHNATQQDVYSECAEEVLQNFLLGYNGTIMAYGQTGAGKTFTMFGGKDSFNMRGIIPRVINAIFMERRNRPNVSITFRISYLEVYKETLADLLSPKFPEPSGIDLTISEDKSGSVHTRGLMTPMINSEDEALELLFEGEYNRAIAEHQLNKASSRSHTVFTIYAEIVREEDGRVLQSKLNLVDLAGSERLSKTRSEAGVAKEAQYINKSLSFLEQVIVALANRSRDHIPYRSSKLTHILKDSLGGNCKTVMIANVWGEEQHIMESLGTCKFAQRMMMVKNEAHVNVKNDSESIAKNYERQIKELKQELTMKDALMNQHLNYDAYTALQRSELRRQTAAFMKSNPDYFSTSPLELTSVQHMKEILWQCRILFHEGGREGQGQGGRGDTAGAGGMMMMEKGDNDAVPSSASRNSTRSDVECVGDLDESDGQSFSLGCAPDFMSPKRDFAHQDALASPGRRDSPTSAPTSSPPPRAMSRDDAFETFKMGEGSALVKILTENKATLKERKRHSRELGKRVNSLKQEIDKLKVVMEKVKQSSGGDDSAEPVVINEDDYGSLMKLKGKKQEYKSSFEELRMIKSEMEYTDKLIEQTAHQLVLEFDEWFVKKFGAAQAASKTNGTSDHSLKRSETTTSSSRTSTATTTMPSSTRPPVVLPATTAELERKRGDLAMSLEEDAESVTFNALQKQQQRRQQQLRTSEKRRDTQKSTFR